MEELREKLKMFMAENDLTLEQVARSINRETRTIWRFLHGVGRPNIRTEYRIRKLVSDHFGE